MITILDCKFLVYIRTKSFDVGLVKSFKVIYHWVKRGEE